MSLGLKEIDTFLKDNAKLVRRINDRQDTSIGFNAFALVSDTYYRENFHSDVIKAILDPHSGHGEGALYLKKFIEFVEGEARSFGKKDQARALHELTVDDTVEVVREEGRVDVKIKGADWTIIVENKINGADDMERQIPRYVRKCRKRRENVVAVVYLTAALPGFPAKYGWKPGDREMVEALLIPVIGFSETRSSKNLAEDWIGPCALATRGFNAKSILEQYAELLRHQSGETMDQDEVKKVMESMGKHGVCRSELLQVLEEMPKTLARIIADEFSGRVLVLKKSRVWSAHPEVAVLDLTDIHLKNGMKVELAIDIHCDDLKELGISLLSRSNAGNYVIEPKAFLPLFKEYDSDFDVGWGDRLVLSMDTDWAFAHVNKFLAKIRKLVDFLEANRERIEAICRGKKV